MLKPQQAKAGRQNFKGKVWDMNTAVVGLGSNIHPAENIQQAKKLLSQKHRLITASRLIETTPIGIKGQNKFLNGTLLIHTVLDYSNFTQSLKEIETLLGRTKRHAKFSPRTIDLDLIVWNREVVHRDFYNRDFVRKLVLEVIPDFKYERVHTQNFPFSP